jgi:oligopeptide/dipeptide ABC transporter ATP-binding protein
VSRSFLELRSVSMTFATRHGFVRALSDIDLSLSKGMCLALVGESGSGKSTLGEIVLGTLSPTAGSILLDGRALTTRRSKSERRRIQLVQQNPMTALNPRHSIARSVGLPVRVHRLRPRPAIRQRVTDLLDTVGISREYLHRHPATLSGGQRQRVALARALAAEPDLLVLDEPTSALDVSVQARVLELLARERRELGQTYLFITHDLGVAHSIATHVAVLYRGRIVEIAPAPMLFRNPRHWYTYLLLSSVPVVSEGEAAARPIWPLPASALADSPDDDTGCAFRTRCPRAVDMCASTMPKLDLVEGHGVACHNPNRDSIAWPSD